jgi:hypothetical protein
MKKDLVYFYDSKKEYHKPLMYSIRSAEKHLDFRHIWLIGKKPDLFNDKIKVIEYDDGVDRFSAGGRYKYFQRTKFELVVEEKGISRDFIWMNDDFYILKNIREILPYHIGELSKWGEKRTGYKKKVFGQLWMSIIRKIENLFPDGYFFEGHFPIVFNKSKMRKVLREIDDDLLAAIRSYYYNTYKIKSECIKDVKVYDTEELEYKKDCPFISSRDKIEREWELIGFLKKRFPDKSSYEN